VGFGSLAASGQRFTGGFLQAQERGELHQGGGDQDMGWREVVGAAWT